MCLSAAEGWCPLVLDAGHDRFLLQVAKLQTEKQQMLQRCSALELENANLQVTCLGRFASCTGMRIWSIRH
jgi:hypothetical protein